MNSNNSESDLASFFIRYSYFAAKGPVVLFGWATVILIDFVGFGTVESEGKR